ncbi:hypothetical protein DUNSADRAFT_14213 [Dunaliella salina]|uniref:Uncharacterized protein n=1 Tax=Dunaliella salina TaxID=3046 RepID=A0ABQ7G809_DUNSA|nr:hypothetical protein DUNSADRAFT_14213 [Dunaliella salina]|eukprot:KAF5830674.1 hypothetical protein DUNSADRAFT_14213 [Dunaliella salina]
MAGKPWLWRSPSDDPAAHAPLHDLYEEMLRRANTLAACVRMQLNSHVIDYNVRTGVDILSCGGTSDETGAATSTAKAAAAAGSHRAQIPPLSPQQPTSQQMQVAQQLAAQQQSQAFPTGGKPGAHAPPGPRHQSAGPRRRQVAQLSQAARQSEEYFNSSAYVVDLWNTAPQAISEARRDLLVDAHRLPILCRDVGALFAAACRLMRALHPLVSSG